MFGNRNATLDEIRCAIKFLATASALPFFCAAMANKQKRKSNSKSPANQQGARRHGWLKWLLSRREHGPERAHRLALAMSFLFAGILTLLSTDRTLHKSSSEKIGPQASQHGWPMVYLKREVTEPLELLRKDIKYDWPYPAVEGESRTFSWLALLVDVIVGLAIVIAIYWCTRRLAQNMAKVKVEAESLLEA